VLLFPALRSCLHRSSFLALFELCHISIPFDHLSLKAILINLYCFLSFPLACRCARLFDGISDERPRFANSSPPTSTCRRRPSRTTGTDYFSACFAEHIPEDSDLVLMEFAINDMRCARRPLGVSIRSSFGVTRHTQSQDTYERLLRGVLDLPSKPAVINMQCVSLRFSDDVVLTRCT
jgi:hypothetical protein